MARCRGSVAVVIVRLPPQSLPELGMNLTMNRSIDRCLQRMNARLETLSTISEAGWIGVNAGPLFPMPSADARAFIERARLEDAGTEDISRSVDRLAELGWLIDAIAVTGGVGRHRGGDELICKSVRALIDLAQVNLPLARLFEGHVNALRLVQLHADPALVSAVLTAVREGAMLGVWGADDGEPVTLDVSSGALSGRKRYASGLGVVTHAIVTARSGESLQLCLVDVRDHAPADKAAWSMSGMRATASGTYDVSAIPPAAVTSLGPSDCFTTEPGLVGGVWRIAAVQLGGVYGLLEAARNHLRMNGRLEDPMQTARLTPLFYRAEAAKLLVERAAAMAEGPAGSALPERAVSQSIATRLMSEEIAQDAIQVVERCVGLPHFADESDSGRIARDLATYVRQVAPDAFLQRCGRETLQTHTPLTRLYAT